MISDGIKGADFMWRISSATASRRWEVCGASSFRSFGLAILLVRAFSLAFS